MFQDPDYHFLEMRVDKRMARSVVRIDQVDTNLRQLGTRPVNAHLSLFRYSKDLLVYKADNIVDGRERTRGYRGPHKADYLLIEIDVDGGSEKLGETLGVLKTILAALTNHWGVPYDSLAVYYSGNRGFHLMVPLSLYGGMPPHTNVPAALFELAVDTLSTPISSGILTSDGDLFQSKYVDTQVYSHLHMLRAPGTIHEATGLWKVALREHELASADTVREAATERRRPYRPNAPAVPALIDMGAEVRRRLSEGQLRYRRFDHSIGKIGLQISTLSDLAHSPLPGMAEFSNESRRILQLLEPGVAQSESSAGTVGRRMRVFKLGCQLRDYGVPRDVTAALLSLLNDTYLPPLDESEFVDAVKGAYET